MQGRTPKIFVSACFSEGAVWDRGVVQILTKRGAEVMTRDREMIDPRMALDMLIQKINACESVVLAIGLSAGPAPAATALSAALNDWEKACPGFTARLGLQPGECPSYAQLEARLAYALGKQVFPVVLADHFPESAAPEPEAARLQQQAHRRIMSGLVRGTAPETREQLEGLIQQLPVPNLEAWKEQPRRIEAQTQKEEPKRRLARTGAITGAAALLLLGAGLLGLHYGRPTNEAVKPPVTFKTPDHPREVVYEVLLRSLAMPLAGSERGAEQRLADAKQAVGKQWGMDALALEKTVLEPWCNEAMRPTGKPSSRLDMALAGYVQGHFGDARGIGVEEAAKLASEEPQDNPKLMEPFVIAIGAELACDSLNAAGKLAEKARTLSTGLSYKERFRYDRIFTWVIAKAGQVAFTDVLWNEVEKEGMALPDEYDADARLAIETWQAREHARTCKYKKAEAILKRCAEDAEKLHGGFSVPLMLVLDEQARVLIEDGQIEEAEKILARCEEQQTLGKTTGDPAFATTNLRLSELYLAKSKLNDAEHHARIALALRKKIFDDEATGAGRTAVAECASQLACVLQQMGKLEEADTLLQGALAAQEQSRGPASLPTSETRRRLAMNRYEQGLVGPAIEAVKLCVDEQFSRFHDTAEYAAALDSYGLINCDFGATDSHAKPFIEAIEVLETNAGSQHLKLATALTHLGMALLNDDKSEEAEPPLRRALAIEEQYGQTQTVQAAETIWRIGQVVNNMGRREEAESGLRRAVDLYQGISGFGHSDLPMAMNSLARCLIAQHKDLESFTLHKQAEAMVVKSLGEGHWLHWKSRLMYAASLEEFGRLEQAIKAYFEACAGLHNTLGDQNTLTRMAYIRRANCAAQFLLRQYPPLPGETQAAYIERVLRLRNQPGGAASPAAPPTTTTTTAAPARDST